MPGPAFSGPLPPLTPNQEQLRTALAGHIRALAHDIGVRSDATYANVQRAAAYIERTCAAWATTWSRWSSRRTIARFAISKRRCAAPAGRRRSSSWARITTPPKAPPAPTTTRAAWRACSAGSHLRLERQSRTVRFLFFPNEEPPSFPTADMGSRHYATAARERNDQIVAMLSIESIGYYDTVKGSQRYPFPLNLAYPDVGDFIGFVSNLKSRSLLHRAIAAFARTPPCRRRRRRACMGARRVVVRSLVVLAGGLHAIMITDTAPYRNPFYHTAQDTPDKLDYGRMARVVHGLTRWCGRLRTD